MFLEDCMFGPEMTGLDVLGEHLAVVMGREPGLSVAMVLAQLSNEFGVDMTRLMVVLQRKKVGKGYDLGKTFLEEMVKDWIKAMVSKH
jgi:hypothetical protein